MTRRFSHWPAPSTDCQTLLLRVPPPKIGLVCSLFEGYEGLAIVRTTDREAGLIEVWVMAGGRSAVEAILAELQTQFSIVRIRETPGHPDLADPSPAKG